MANIRARRGRGGARAGVRIKRAYEEPAPNDGYRVLVDRLWPRGARKESLAIEAWSKDVAPSDELRRWFGHDEARWREFEQRYREELAHEPAASVVDELVARAKRQTITLVYGAKDEAHNQAVVLRDLIEKRIHAARPRSSNTGSARTSSRSRSRAQSKGSPT